MNTIVVATELSYSHKFSLGNSATYKLLAISGCAPSQYVSEVVNSKHHHQPSPTSLLALKCAET